MKTLSTLFLSLVCLSVLSQSNFDTTSYHNFINTNKNMVYTDLLNMHPLKNAYFKGINNGSSIYNYTYLDSITQKFELTTDELALIEENHFMVSERLSYKDFGNAFAQIYYKDMPTFISTDAVLHAVHMSYDAILFELEKYFLQDNLTTLCSDLYNNLPTIIEKYKNDSSIFSNIKDIDIYITVANCLITNTIKAPHVASSNDISTVLNAIESESYANIPLFSDAGRNIDFSQFKVRGHYTDDLEEYFKTMMWFGRIDFSLSDANLNIADINRMTIDAFLLNECMELCDGFSTIGINENIIEYFVGESDNLKPLELKSVLTELNIESAVELTNSETIEILRDTLMSNSEYQQSILGNILISNPYSSTATPLPLSYKLMGQRFIIDSYILSNLVYDKIIFEYEKIWRPMPNPLDAMFVLGNENALPLLEAEINSYKYGSNLASLKYLIDSYDSEFWSQSYYNSWLNAIRKLNSPTDLSNYPLFCKSAAWQHLKLNTQLASWAQLRHDNLLYAKPSYTGGTTCDFPHAYVEPNAEFYYALGTMSNEIASFFTENANAIEIAGKCKSYFEQFGAIMDTLGSIAQKEINGELFNEQEIFFLKSVIYHGGGGCKKNQDGWYPKLFYLYENEFEEDYIIADIHTQPTDEYGNMVGNVMHVGTGKVNLGVFLSKCPSHDLSPMAYIGPVFSYYEKYTTNFERINDEEWATMVQNNSIPERPNWANIFLANENGNSYETGLELPSSVYTIAGINNKIAQKTINIALTPNPANQIVNISFTGNNAEFVRIKIYDNSGKLVKSVSKIRVNKGTNSIKFNISELNKGVYHCVVKGSSHNLTSKLIKL